MTSVAVNVTPPTAGDCADAESLMIVEPRCKVCQSEHRTQIDAMLRRGDSQASVRRHVNDVLGHAAFTANNLSVHSCKHLYGPDPADWIRKSARAQRMLGDPNALPSRPTPEDALRTVMEVGLRLIDAGVTVPESGDVIRAAKELECIGSEGMRATKEEMLREIKAFTKAVKNTVPEEMWNTLYDEFEEILAQTRGASTTT